MEGEKKKKIGRTTSDPKTIKLNLRLTQTEAENIQYCADKLNTSRVDAINKGIEKLKKEIDKK